MDITRMFLDVPLGLFFVLTLAVVTLSAECGFLIGGRLLRREKSSKEGPAGAIVGATMGLLAFMLAFTFGVAAARFDARKQLLLDEVNAIGTAILRTDFLPKKQSEESKKAFKEYVGLRAGVVQKPETLPKALEESEKLHDFLWARLMEAAPENSGSELLALYTESLNEVIDMHTKRVTVGLQYHIPSIVWMILYFLTAMSMGVLGYQFGVSGARRPAIILVMALSLSSVFLLIADLDRGSEGMLKVSQAPMLDLKKKLEAQR